LCDLRPSATRSSCTFARQLTGASLQEIGREFGGRHHTTVLHFINEIDEMRRSDKVLNSAIMRLVDACAS